MRNQNKAFNFIKPHNNVTEVLINHKLASLGDAYINFVYSLALSNRKGEPSGAKVRGNALANALRKTGLRERMPSRISRHTMADAAEALIVYAWLHNHITLEESVTTLQKSDDLTEGLKQIIITIIGRIKFS